MIETETSVVYGLVCLGLLVVWVWNLVLGIQVMRHLRENLRWFEKWRDKIEELFKYKNT